MSEPWRNVKEETYDWWEETQAPTWTTESSADSHWSEASSEARSNYCSLESISYSALTINVKCNYSPIAWHTALSDQHRT